MEIKGVKVPETIEELNALGFWLKIIEEDLSETFENIKTHLGEDPAEVWLDNYSDFGCNRIRDAYRAGVEGLLKRAIANVTDALVKDKTLMSNIYWAVVHVSAQEQEKIDLWYRENVKENYVDVDPEHELDF
ncbi:MAG: hypothetical protein J6D21_07900 [Clostridia bacterium]|nr:hypothetical protein [Clostridia bacterium]MBO5248847.1 hypothetical protein [Clostridia bacterium]